MIVRTCLEPLPHERYSAYRERLSRTAHDAFDFAVRASHGLILHRWWLESWRIPAPEESDGLA